MVKFKRTEISEDAKAENERPLKAVNRPDVDVIDNVEGRAVSLGAGWVYIKENGDQILNLIMKNGTRFVALKNNKRHSVRQPDMRVFVKVPDDERERKWSIAKDENGYFVEAGAIWLNSETFGVLQFNQEQEGIPQKLHLITREDVAPIEPSGA